MRRFLALALGAAVVAAVSLGIGRLLAPTPPTRGTADGLPIISVPEALAVRPTLDETQPIAVTGWYSTGFPHSCPAPSGPNGEIREVAALELYCQRGETILAELDEAAVDVTVRRDGDSTSVSSIRRAMAGSYLDPVLIGRTTEVPIIPDGTDPWDPQPIVAVGHFADHRAADCQPEDRAFCLGVFVIEHLPAIRGMQSGPTISADPGMGDTPVTPPPRAEAEVRSALGVGATILWLAAVRGRDVPGLDDRGPPIAELQIVWVARTIERGPAGTAEPRLVTVVVDDATQRVLWTSRRWRRDPPLRRPGSTPRPGREGADIAGGDGGTRDAPP